MKKIMLAFSAAVCLFSYSSEAIFNNVDSYPNHCCGSFLNSSLEGALLHTEGRGLSYSTGYSSIDLFSRSCSNDNFIPFIDLRAHVFNNGEPAANAGMGLRYLDTCNEAVYGVNVYYDYRDRFRDYHQIGVGVERLSECFDFRLNGYLPIGNHVHRGREHIFTFPGDFFAICRQRQKSLGGLDAEIGAPLLQWCGCEKIDIYGAIGPYYYFREECNKDLVGGRARLAATFPCLCDALSFEFETTYDRLYHSTVQGTIRLEIPFPSCASCNDCCDSQLRCMARQPVWRNEIIVLDKKHCRFRTNF